MSRSWKIGNAFGIDLFVHWSFLIIPFLALMANIEHGLTAGVAGVGLVLALFGCVVLHELGHALAARHFGIGTRDITLYPIGGIARLESMPERPFAEFVIAIAGPLVNVVIAAGLWFGLHIAGLTMGLNAMYYGSLGHSLLAQLLLANVGLVVFNLIPAFPMDGGRVLRAALAQWYGRVAATEMAVRVARVLAYGFIALAIGSVILPDVVTFGTPMLALIGVFIMAAGTQELMAVRQQQAYRTAAQYVTPAKSYVTAQSPGPGWSGFTWDPRTGLWVQWRDGQPVNR